MLRWAQAALSRRSLLLGGGAATIGATAICSTRTVAQETHGYHAAAGTPKGAASVPSHQSAHGAMITAFPVPWPMPV